MVDRDVDEAMMRIALDHAMQARDKGNTPVAAVIAKDGERLAVGENEVRSTGDCTAHAEIVALRKALAAFDAETVHGATCYTTMEPCPMCAWALVEGGIARIVMGARHRQVGRKAYGAYALEDLFAMTGQTVAVTTGVLAEDCGAMRLAWMRAAGRES
ncbi:MAG: nucleoside deaminase [Pseudomonadota bacterium]